MVGIDCQVPKRSHSAGFYLDAAGEVRELTPARRSPGEPFDRLVCPETLPVTVQGEGLVLFLAVAVSEGKPLPGRDEVRGLLEETGLIASAKDGTWRQLPGDVLGVARSEEAALRAAAGGDRPEPAAQRLKGCLSDLRERLRAKCDWFEVVALPVKASR
jgi:hypothetical protein